MLRCVIKLYNMAMGLRSLARLKNYHPADILKQKRAKKLAELESAKKSTVADAPGEAPVAVVSAEDQMMNAAMAYLTEMSDALDQFISKLGDL